MSEQRPYLRTVFWWVPVIFLCVPFSAAAVPNRAPEIQVIDFETREVQDSWLAFDESYQGGVDVAVGDVGGDGINEIVVAQAGGPDALGIIKVFRGDHSLISQTAIFHGTNDWTYLDVECGDVDGDGEDEIIVSVPDGASSKVWILDGMLQEDTDTAGTFEAFPEFPAGTAIAVGNVLNGPEEEIIAATVGGLFPLVRILDSNGVMQAPDISPFSETDTYGLIAAAINTGGGEHSDLYVGFDNGGQTWIKGYRIDANREYPVLAEFQAWSREFRSGVEMAAIDADGDGTEEIAVVPAGDQQAEVKYFRGDGTPLDVDSQYLFEEGFRGGMNISVASIDKDQTPEIIISPGLQHPKADPERPARYIEVNLTEQIEYVWEDGYLRNVFLISSGLPGTPTPVGEFSVFNKILNHLYSGPGYYLPNTPYNLAFATAGNGMRFYLHSAYWHNNFGHPMSHGCVNMRYNDAKFLYNWADIGTLVWTHY
ncbi:MAG: L,D-transpeptidase family protein [Candidatus Kerfeldbacteria bacterium]